MGYAQRCGSAQNKTLQCLRALIAINFLNCSQIKSKRRAPAIATLIRVVVAGSRSGGTKLAPTAPAMPAMAGRLTNEQVAAVLTYIRNAWGNAAAAVRLTKSTSSRAT
jgi:hypothetical protein